jgi:hypothetical protein
MTGRPRLRLLPGGRRRTCAEPRPRRDVLLELAGLRIVAEARVLLVVLADKPGLLEVVVADPQVRAALLPLLDAAEEYEEHAERARGEG